MTFKKEVQLKPHQKENIQFVKDNHFVLIADEMGLGKTFSALASVKEQNHYPCLIICPKPLINNWYREIKRIDHYKTVDIVKNTKHVSEVENGYFKKDYTIVNYDKWKLFDSFPKCQSIILDEVHYIKSYKAKRAIATRDYRNRVMPSTVIGLSGTPVTNKGTEILEIINSLHENHIDKWKFFAEYCYTDEWSGAYVVRPEKVKEINEMLIQKKLMIRHKMDLSDLGVDKFREEVSIDIKKKEYDKFVQNMYEMYGGFNLGGLQKIRTKIAELKIDSVIEYSENLIKSSEQKVIIFTTFQHSANIIAERMKLKVHHGSTSDEDKKEALHDFETNPKTRALVLSIGTGGTGLNLTHANHCVFADFNYSPALMKQAEHRILRIGQEHDVVFHYLFADGTIDEDVVKALIEKSKIQNGIIDGEEYHYDNRSIEQTMVDKLNKMFAEFGQHRKLKKK